MTMAEEDKADEFSSVSRADTCLLGKGGNVLYVIHSPLDRAGWLGQEEAVAEL